jgi:hypothetical protein
VAHCELLNEEMVLFGFGSVFGLETFEKRFEVGAVFTRED